MANWFQKGKNRDLQEVVTKDYPDLWDHHIQVFDSPILPDGYEVVKTDEDAWAVIGPVSQPQQFDEEREQLVREENLDMPDDQALRYITHKALQRLSLV